MVIIHSRNTATSIGMSELPPRGNDGLNLETAAVSRILKTDCLTWAARFGEKASPSAFNHTVGTLKLVLDMVRGKASPVRLGASWMVHFRRGND